MTAVSGRDGRKMGNYEGVRVMPVCPDCGNVMVKTHYRDADDGEWRVCWTCECKPRAEEDYDPGSE